MATQRRPIARLAKHREEKEEARGAIERYLKSLDEGLAGEAGSHGATWHQPRQDEWTVSIVGSSQQVVNVELTLGEYTLRFMSFFMRGPDENKAEVIRLLLCRNLELSMAKFATDEFGDIYLRADLPVHGVSEAELDRVIGILYACSDSNYLPVMRLGFESAMKLSNGRG